MTLQVEPGLGSGKVLFTGECLRVRMEARGGRVPPSAQAFLRTNLNSSPIQRGQVIDRVERRRPHFSAGWRDIPMKRCGPRRFEIELIAFEPGYYEWKPFLEVGQEHVWPPGLNSSVSVQPLKWRGGNTIYCAFPRQFGPFKHYEYAWEGTNPPEALVLDGRGFAVIPPGGTLADLALELPFLFHELGIRILHLLPMQETPTHYGRMGRYGSPYAAGDLRSVNHALVPYRVDRTPAEQFQEFCARVHAFGGEVLLDLAANHLGWATELINDHPEWFVRGEDRSFISPGAWGVVWEDLVELNFDHRELWEYIADSLLLWCGRGVDGFRADAGYQIPSGVWEYITAKVHGVYPDTLFLLEGLGGPWEATESILRMGGMQWAYSEMFQQQGMDMLDGYLQHLDWCSNEIGILANYAETHDNDRLALRGPEYVRHRLALCALTSSAGAFGFTNGVEWLAREKFCVHGSSGLRWGHPENVVDFIARLNQVLRVHPVFQGTARIRRLPDLPEDILGFVRESTEERVAAFFNLSNEVARSGIALPNSFLECGGIYRCSLTGREVDPAAGFGLDPLEFICLDLKRPAGPEDMNDLTDQVRQENEEIRLRAFLGQLCGEGFDLAGFDDLVGVVRERGLACFLAAVQKGPGRNAGQLADMVGAITSADQFLALCHWSSAKGDRLLVASTGQVLYLEEQVPFRVELIHENDSFEVTTFQDFGNGRTVGFCRVPEGAFTIVQSRLDRPASHLDGEPRWVLAEGHAIGLKPQFAPVPLNFSQQEICPEHRFLLTNQQGSYSLLPLAPRTISSKYDALLAANLHPFAPDERMVLLKRLRVWLVTSMMSYPLDGEYLVEFQRWPEPHWIYEYRLPEGSVHIVEQVELSPAENEGRTAFTWDSPAGVEATLVLRPDVEFRGHHGETKARELDEAAFARSYVRLDENGQQGFQRGMTDSYVFEISSPDGKYVPEPEWLYNIAHPHEATRGQTSSGDAFSPGYFKIPLNGQRNSVRIYYSVKRPQGKRRVASFPGRGARQAEPKILPQILERALGQFLVRRGSLQTIMAGYPWFLDWGRDSFIAARGCLSQGMVKEVTQLVLAFAALEENGTLPNALAAENASDRDTSDAPLWFLVTVEELAASQSWDALVSEARSEGVDLAATLRSICDHYLTGTPNGIVCDPASGLVYSPPHFTWMDTNFPAATPREGYPIEIQALWIRALEFIGTLFGVEEYGRTAQLARDSLESLFWLKEPGYFADCLAAGPGTPASEAITDESLRPNQLYPVAFGLISPDRARQTVIQTHQHLVVPAGLRSVASLELRSWPWAQGAQPPAGLNPMNPYRGRYEGDEDASRKLAYHNGTAWAQLLPLWTEALLASFPGDERAAGLAKALLRTFEIEVRQACIGQLSEISDGDFPHEPRGCCAQAWAVSEVLRVWDKL